MCTNLMLTTLNILLCFDWLAANFKILLHEKFEMFYMQNAERSTILLNAFANGARKIFKIFSVETLIPRKCSRAKVWQILYFHAR